MRITKVKYFLIERKSEKYPLANCIIVIDNVLLLGGIKLYEGKKGKYIVFPEKAKFDRTSSDNTADTTQTQNESTMEDTKKIHKDEIYHPVQKDFSNYLKNVIIEGYRRAVEEREFIYYPTEAYLGNGENEVKDGQEEGSYLP
jgi:DNA-binding cell septation regulator SpoVG